ncbi:hypothetical protein [Roseisalinus antarcticus]|uniref:Uncharacterized protein n=1 Tax=Roseisalinus antarcticus TaxID=254357 RepID=A0A1Y5U3U0_9RHOB|nr:hypothetical protein [Roseisalinus antarcticus]SLN76571.1 hypothetical protein ROA7023_04210 [Roseisalinus antarcticus]
MIRSLLVVLLSVVAGAATAQTVAIRSGWQAEFTRLVFSIPPAVEWELTEAEEGYLLTLDDPTVVYDLEGVFERIPQSRLANLTPDGNALKIDLACDCRADAFLWRPDRLVIDIKDGTAEDGADTVVASDGAGSQSPPAVADEPLVRLPLIVTDTAHSYEVLLPEVFHERDEDQIAETERTIIESVARAASQGLIDAVPASATEAAPPDAEPVEVSEEPPVPAEGLVPPDIGLVARTSIDRDLANLAMPFAGGTIETACPGNEVLRVADWGDARSFHAQLGEVRRSLSGGAGPLPLEESLTLARRYLYFGFGHEAAFALRSAETTTAEVAMLSDVAMIIEGERTRSGILETNIECGGSAALWAALALGEIPSGQDFDRDSVIFAFLDLPQYVQGAVGGELANILLEHGDIDASMIFLGRTERATDIDSEGLRLASIDVEMMNGDPRQTFSELLNLARTRDRYSEEIILRIFDLANELDVPVPRDILDLSAVYRFEADESPRLRKLISGEVQATLFAGDFQRALDIVNEESRRIERDHLQVLNSSIAFAVAREVDDVSFLTFSLEDLPRPLLAGAENAIAARLLQHGLADAAQDVLMTTPYRRDASERRYLRAEIALQLGELDAVGDILTAMTDPRSNRIRAEALTLEEDYVGAFSLEGPEIEGTEDTEAAWRAGAWERLAESDIPEVKAVSEMILELPPEEAFTVPQEQAPAGPGDPAGEADPQDDIEGPLARSNAILQRSYESRDIVAQALERFSVEN